MNGLTFIALIALAVAIAIAYRIGVVRGERAARRPMSWPTERPAERPAEQPAARTAIASPASASISEAAPTDIAEPVPAAVEASTAASGPARSQCAELAEDRHRLFARLADALTETARYRQIVIDIEHNAPPPLLGAPGAPDDLKLIVGVGPALERMLFQMGITNYRQIARWSERDIDEIDARLAEFPGRIRRDAWVTQARALHQSKYGERP
jgi:predicted flap endonuclease-1-like 5' DNA nuclease